MKVILREDVPGVGSAGQTVEVKSGYGRNFLLPRHLAIPATKANVKSIDTLRQQQDVRVRKARRAAESIKDKLEKLSLSAEVLVGEEDKVFGSVTNADIAELIEKEGVTIDKKAIQLEQPLKALGVYTIPIKVAKDVTADVKVWIVKKS